VRIGHSKDKTWWCPAYLSHDADKVNLYPEAAREAAMKTFQMMMEFRKKNPKSEYGKAMKETDVEMLLKKWLTTKYKPGTPAPKQKVVEAKKGPEGKKDADDENE
jgi:hypothetical protein